MSKENMELCHDAGSFLKKEIKDPSLKKYQEELKELCRPFDEIQKIKDSIMSKVRMQRKGKDVSFSSDGYTFGESQLKDLGISAAGFYRNGIYMGTVYFSKDFPKIEELLSEEEVYNQIALLIIRNAGR